MSESTYRTMTLEHLGADATAEDLALFQAACRHIQDTQRAAWPPLPVMTDAEVTGYIWGDGDWRGRALAAAGPDSVSPRRPDA